MANSISRQHEYQSKLNFKETHIAIKSCKDYFESSLSESLNLLKVSAPIILKGGKGLNDNLNGVERTVSFDAIDLNKEKIEIVQSLAKWKRVALSEYGFKNGEGLYTDMHAIRRDESLDCLHSIYVDQWDWEKVISLEKRNISTLKEEVQKIYNVLRKTEKHVHQLYPALKPMLPEKIFFIRSDELEYLYPDKDPKERENIIAKKYGAVFIMQIGGPMPSGKSHDRRSPDYDDWTLNGDIILWYPLLNRALELSSMGIRVDRKALLKQLRISKDEHRKTLDYHQAILNGNLPHTIGGGIGQSRLCMFLLKKAHIGEVQASVWNETIIKECKKRNIPLL
ncbi:aspartate-ammonia ligase [Cytobacillus oceanisediminis]|uniref:Aspartate--ammonia ligase n=1 Tax=Cytobacillus oceanisediminis TaxID=665099 RepID=A0A2V2ZLL7_9BACI|nr:aspartate--ammonia ligase [Cytobacillus oceanisediminis]PWW20763.1 aspartate-ammonia ligase [Cytobacillus oceanisediminis]